MPFHESHRMARARADARLQERADQRRTATGKRPLRRPLRERFVRAYLLSFDAVAAARKAGYGPGVAPRIAPVLLRDPEVQARLRHLSLQGVGPVPKPREVLETALRRVFVDLSGLCRVDPASGAVRLDLRSATPEQLGALTIKQVSRVVKGREEVTTTVSTPDRSREFGLVARALAARGLDEEEEPDEYNQMMARAMRDVIQAGGSAFTPHWTSGFPDEVIELFHPMKKSYGPGESPFRIPPAYHLLFPNGPGEPPAVGDRLGGNHGGGVDGPDAAAGRGASGDDGAPDMENRSRGATGRAAGAEGGASDRDGPASGGRGRSAEPSGLKYGAVPRRKRW